MLDKLINELVIYDKSENKQEITCFKNLCFINFYKAFYKANELSREDSKLCLR